MESLKLAPEDMPVPPQPRTLADVLRWRARNHPDRLALTYLADGETETVRLTYGQIDRLARAMAARLQALGARDRSVILLFPPGPEFLVGFLGCVYAGARGVPLYPPDPKRLARTLPRFLAIVEDGQADLIVTNTGMHAMAAAVLEYAPRFASKTWVVVNDVPPSLADAWVDPGVDIDEIAFLQYTSGSTGDPKGVEVTHRGLLLNFALLNREFRAQPGETMVTWLPNYHDMGLIDGWLRPLYAGCHCVGMPPMAFLKRPSCWLQAFSRYRGSTCCAPNFAYELCLERVTDEEIRTLDLSCWRVATNAAEPVRPATLRRFAERFASTGFKPEAQCPGYGLAEATLFVSLNPPERLPTLVPVSRTRLEQHRVVEVDPADPDAFEAVGVGEPVVDLVIVDPETRVPCPPDGVGEIWLAGPTLARGYWNRPDVNRELFGALLAGPLPEGRVRGPWLRTGDLGFLRQGELFIAGRRKDLIIIRGRNLYPQDVERTTEQAHPALFRNGCNAAFSADIDGEERLVVVQEVQRRFQEAASAWKDRRLPDPAVEAFAPTLTEAPDLDHVMRSVRAAVVEAHGVEPFAIVLVKPGSIPKTSSGKIQRRATRSAWTAKALDLVFEWRAPVVPVAPLPALSSEAPAATPGSHGRSAEEIGEWLRATLSQRLGLPVGEVGGDRPFAELGLDSRGGVTLVADLEKWLGTPLPASLLYDRPTVDQVVAWLVPAGREPTPAPAVAASGPEPVAIVGMGCRFPGADDPEAFWRLLRDGLDGTSEVPADRWRMEDLYDPDPAAPGKMWSKRGGFLREVDRFDARAFDVTAREAARMDPQQRLLLEVAVEALESGGIRPPRDTGVFVGVASFDWGRYLFQDRSRIDAFFGTGAALSITANRISYHLDLHGPSLAVDSACSSSLVAVHLALGSLRRGECSLALVGGVNLLLLPDIHVTFTKAGVLSPGGRCRTFDAAGDGMTRAEGAGVVVLKPLSRALADGNAIYAVIHGSAVNSDGRSNGLMAPNGPAQQAVIEAAWRDAGRSPAAAQYVEAHGTGTALGDPVEVTALAAAACAERRAGDALRVGSVKSNIGHLEAAAGIAGLCKVALSLRHRALVPSLHFEQPNPRIPFADLKVSVQTRHEPWPAPEGQGLAGISSFGFGGTNAHVVLGEAPAEARCPVVERRPAQLALFTGPSEAGLRGLAGTLATWLGGAGAGADPAAVARGSLGRPVRGSWRLAVAGATAREMGERLAAFAAGQPAPGVASGEPVAPGERKVAFVFPGQGGHWHAMGRDLLAEEPSFRAEMERIDAAFQRVGGWSLLEELALDEPRSRVADTAFAQPLLFAVQASLAALWRSWGVEPAAVVGHSMGEVTAAFVAGKLTLEEAVCVIHHRGRLMSTLRGTGAMLAVELPLAEAMELAVRRGGRLGVAVNNAPTSTVLAGEPEAIAVVAQELADRGVFCRPVRVDVAGHSAFMDPILQPLAESVGAVPNRAPTVPIVSTVTGTLADSLAFDGVYQADNVRRPVRFREAAEALLARGIRVFLECSPHPTLQNAVGQVAAGRGVEAVAFGSLRRDLPSRAALLATAGSLHVLGVPLDAARLLPPDVRAVPLPAGPWDRQRHWLEHGAGAVGTGPVRRTDHPLLDHHTTTPDTGAEAWECVADLAAWAWVGEHRVQGHAVLPATGYVELVRAAWRRTDPGAAFALADVRFLRALLLGEGVGRRIHVRFQPAAPGGDAAATRAEFQVWSRPAEAASSARWTLHATGRVVADDAGPLPAVEPADAGLDEVAVADHYASFLARGIDYRGPFRSVVALRRRGGEALGTVALAPEHAAHGFDVHPGLLDACLQVMGSVLPAGEGASVTFMPTGIDRVRITGQPGTPTLARVVHRGGDGAAHRADVHLAGVDGVAWGIVEGLTVSRVDDAAAAETATEAALADWTFTVDWEAVAHQPGEVAPAGTWLLLPDGGGVAEGLARLLTEQGRRVEVVDPADVADPARCEARLAAVEGTVARVVHLATLDDRTTDDCTGEQVHSGVVEACVALVHLARALSRRKGVPACALWAVTRGAEPVEGPVASLAGASLWGLGRSLAHEHAAFWGGLVDLDGQASPAALLPLLEAPDREDQQALRAGRRLVPRLVRRPTAAPPSAWACDASGTWLVTGGLGSLGLRLARWLVDRGARHLLLTGRSGYAPRSDWASLAASGDPRAVALVALEDAGARVRIGAVDAADEAAMAGILADPSLPPLVGVIHAAGVVDPRPVVKVSRDDLTAELRPKTAGAWVLHRLTRHRALQAFVLFASASGIWGSRLLASYGAANHVLDGLASLRGGLGLPALAVDWAMWGGGGMAAGQGSPTDTAHQRFLEKSGLRPMPPEQALAVLEALVASPMNQATVAWNDWSVLKSLFEQEPRRRLLARIAVRAAGSGEASPPGAGFSLQDTLRALPDTAARRALLFDLVATQVGEVLGVKGTDLDPERSLLELGLDSLTANDLQSRLHRAVGVKVPVLTLLKGDGVGRVADRVADQVVGALGLVDAGDDAGLGPTTGPDAEVLDDDIQPAAAGPAGDGPPRRVLLTGASGFLGAFVLRELVRQTRARVICLVRAENDEAARERLQRHLEDCLVWSPEVARRVVAVAGDLARPRLGLDPARWDALASELDAIYHVGFLVNFLFSYEDLRAANVRGTVEILRLASAVRRKAVHFTSSFSVLLTPEYAGVSVGEEAPLHPGAGGYREGKRACECLIAEARRRGLPVTVYRPPFIGWESRSGVFNDRDFLIRLIQGCVALGAAPALDVVFYLAPVDFVSWATVALSRNPTAANRTFNLLVSPEGMGWTDVVGILREAGARLDLVPFEAWRQLVAAAGPANPLHPFFPLMGSEVQESGSAVLDLFHHRSAPARIELQGTRSFLGEPSCPQLDVSLARILLDALSRTTDPDQGSP